MPALRFPRCFASAAVCRQHLYILGGAWLDSEMESSSFSSVYDIDVYNPVSKVWEGITALSIGRHDFGVAVLGEYEKAKVFIICMYEKILYFIGKTFAFSWLGRLYGTNK